MNVLTMLIRRVMHGPDLEPRHDADLDQTRARIEAALARLDREDQLYLDRLKNRRHAARHAARET